MIKKIEADSLKIAIIGLGYVGLPLAIEFSKKYKTIGYDINKKRVYELKQGVDSTNEIEESDLYLLKEILFTDSEEDISDANVYIVTVPTPIDDNKQPDLRPLISASELLGKVIKAQDYIIYESTVYPGATEEVCIPILEKESGLLLNKDFYVGYSPERINPGDKLRPVSEIMKVTSGSNAEAASFVDFLYKSIIKAGTYKAESIKVAEASKIIENTQRDVNIALMNELAVICNLIGISTNEVINAASTKWNFIKLQPGLVGGHCIGVDPYYLVHKSMSLGYIPSIIRKAREVNDNVPKFLVSKLVKEIIKIGGKIKGSKMLVLGATFKENCPDIRNSKVFNVILELRDYDVEIDLYDPYIKENKDLENMGVSILKEITDADYSAVIIAVAHNEFVKNKKNIFSIGNNETVFFDVKDISDSDLERVVKF